MPRVSHACLTLIQPKRHQVHGRDLASPPLKPQLLLANGELAHSAQEQRVVWRARAVLRAQLPSKAPCIYGVQPQPVMWAAAGELLLARSWLHCCTSSCRQSMMYIAK
jgi:hypothetical protein